MKGIVIACPQKYENFCLQNLVRLRTDFQCELPIEIWEVGNEISFSVKNQMYNQRVIFKNVKDYCANLQHWKGFQVKAFCLQHSEFDEVILCDADVTFYKSPEMIFQDDDYLRTGTYFFKDLDQWVFRDVRTDGPDKFTSLAFYNQRKAFVRRLLPTKPTHFPVEWEYVYEDTVPRTAVKEALQESGVVFFDKRRLSASLAHIYALNDEHKETYKYVWGDKETFWLGCLMAGQDFYFNPEAGYLLEGALVHAYKGDLFWRQK